MLKREQSGSVVTLVIIAVLAVGLVAASIFGLSAYSERQDTRKNLANLIAKAVADAEAAQAAKLKAQFDEEAKSPTKTYSGPSTYGSVSFSYPKTWSSYVDESSATQPVSGFFHPNQVPSLQSKTAFALRMELSSVSYSSELQKYSQQIKLGTLKATAFIPPKMTAAANVQPGTRLDGALSTTQKGSMAIIKIRDKTLKIYTESADFTSDFNNIVLPSLTFTP